MDDGGAAGKGQAAKAKPSAPGPLVLTRKAETRASRRRRTRHARAARGAPWMFIAVIVLGLLAVFGGLALTGKPIRLPVWAVAEAEARINTALRDAVTGRPGVAGPPMVSLGGAVIVIDRRDWAPRLLLEDLRVLQPGGEALVTMPEARLAFDPASILTGKPALRSLRLIGPRVALRRLEDGRFDIRFGGQMPLPEFASVAEALAAAEALFKRPGLAALQKVEAEGLSVVVDDRQQARVWQMGDGRLTFENRADALALGVGLSLVSGGEAPAQARLTLVSFKSSAEARMSVGVDQVAAADIAAQSPALAWLGLIAAPISGSFASSIDAEGRLGSLDARLELGQGALSPGSGAAPVAFDRAGMFFTVDAARARIDLNELTVESPSLRLAASGYAYLPGLGKGVPQSILGQIAFRQVRVDPEGLFDAPAEFSSGALDLRLRLDPFRVDIGQLALVDGARRLVAHGHIEAARDGWRVAMDVALDEIDHRRLIALWPVALVPKTREWLSENVGDGTLFDVRAAMRLAPGTDPRVSLSYEYSGAGVRFMRSLPPIEDGYGYATVEGTRYTMVLDRGRVLPGQGGAINVAGSVFTVPDITAKPSTAEIDLHTEGSLTASLSLLDMDPFNFLTKAGQPVDLGEGRASVRAALRVPLAAGSPDQVTFDVTGTVRDFRSDTLVPGKTIEAPELSVTANPALLAIAGKGTLDGVPFDARFTQPLGKGVVAAAQVTGTVEITRAGADRLRLGLPATLISGRTEGAVTLDLPRGEPPLLRLTSQLQGAGLSVPQLGWSKPAGSAGRLDVTARLGSPARVERLQLEASGLLAEGSVGLNADGTLALLRFDRLRVGQWLDAQVDLRGQGGARAPSVTVLGGSLDLRRLGTRGGGGGSGGGPVEVALDRVIASEGIAFTGLRGRFDSAGGLSGQFSAGVNGQGAVSGTVTPERGGSNVRMVSDDAGTVLSAAGIFPNARGGTLEASLRPARTGSDLVGDLAIRNVRVRNTPVLAELINAISVVGLLEQLDGQGLTFSNADAKFRLTDTLVEVTDGAAVGASLGVSLAGVYEYATRRLRMQGVISPVYLVNGIGAVLTRRGEGLFGFNYQLTGTADKPDVSVNPLSILTPGMFREIFRNPAPTANNPRDGSAPPPGPPAPKDVYER